MHSIPAGTGVKKKRKDRWNSRKRWAPKSGKIASTRLRAILRIYAISGGIRASWLRSLAAARDRAGGARRHCGDVTIAIRCKRGGWPGWLEQRHRLPKAQFVEELIARETLIYRVRSGYRAPRTHASTTCRTLARQLLCGPKLPTPFGMHPTRSLWCSDSGDIFAPGMQRSIICRCLRRSRSCFWRQAASRTDAGLR